jgi:TQXA domain-containing protein/LPXTG-motif cell wall-anchored protein
MISVRRRVVSRLAATALATALFAGGAIATAGSAAADENNSARSGGATATLEGLKTHAKVKVEKKKGDTGVYNAGLFQMNVDGAGTIMTYCIDFDTGAVDGYKYKETGWDSSTLADKPVEAAKIHWILRNSYPQVNDLAALAAKVGATELTEEEAAAGTQAAIWHLSDGVTATPEDENAKILTTWLLDEALELAEPEQPSLELEPNQVGGIAGEQVGPVTVNTSADSVVVTVGAEAAAQGVTLIDGDGQLIGESTPVTNGTELFFDVPADAEDGEATFTASVTTTVPLGRAFTSLLKDTQTMILAGSTDSSVTASATGKWAAEDTDEPLPTVTAKEDCVVGGVAVTVENKGTQDYVFELADQTKTIAPLGEDTIVVAVDNKQPYEIAVDDGTPEGKIFKGVLDCAGEPPVDEPEETEEPNEPTPDGDSDEPDLAETGSDSNVGLIAGIAIALLVLGGAAVFFLRKKTRS